MAGAVDVAVAMAAGVDVEVEVGGTGVSVGVAVGVAVGPNTTLSSGLAPVQLRGVSWKPSQWASIHPFVLIVWEMVEGNTVPDHDVLPYEAFAVHELADVGSTLDFRVVRGKPLTRLIHRHVELVVCEGFDGRSLVNMADA